MPQTMNARSLLIACVISFLANAHSSAAQAAELSLLAAMTQTVEQRGISEFLVVARESGWEPPAIRSAFWVSEMPKDKPEAIKIEEAKRAFGKAVSKKIDAVCMDVFTKGGAAERKHQADLLLSFAEWVKAPHSYGNLLLFTRAENLAATPVAYLVADVQVPLADIEPFFKRFTSAETHADIRGDVLNEEARRKLVPKLAGNAEQREDALAKVWSEGYRKARQWCEKRGIKGEIGASIRPEIDPELRVFCDDDGILGGIPRTTTARWDFKILNSVCVFGTGTNTLHQVQRFALFREKLGYFPDQVPSWWNERDKVFSRTAAAFEGPWQPFKKEFGNAYSSAASVMELLRANRLYDEETKLVLGNAYKD